MNSEMEYSEITQKDYKKMAKSQIGETLKDDFCNGFFGSRNFSLSGARITKIYEENNDNEEMEIVIEIQYENGKYDYGYFQESFADWDSVAEHLEKWINTDASWGSN